MSFSAVIVAAGGGSRAGAGPAKQWRLVTGRPVVRWSVEAFLAAGATEVLVVIPAGAEAELTGALSGLEGWRAVSGGASRAASVQAGLAASNASDETPVLIHDAARPFLTRDHIHTLLEALKNAEGAAPALPVADTLKRRDGDAVTTTSRDGLWRVQTPQAFRRSILVDAYAAWRAPADPTDDCAVVEAAGGRIALTAGDPMLMKLTYPEDFAMAERLAGGARITRIGQGFDAHRWGPGEEVWLCGVAITHDETLIGHSDADAGLHALTDALLGAIGEGDIGDHFPPTDPKWKGASSDRFLIHAAELIAAKGGRIINIDVTLICERPKIKPHRAAMRERLATLLDLPLDRVSVKATTTEGMGFTGRGEGLAAQAVATVETPL
ncbi:bifunctional 2-C-methyl-D-erythritol 4-phosphate cytidylyltransferase/2-C-methyl-D-erythritol 2,4-cyclodiphosphate synthase [Caulobacter sp. NIBR2454]|uniref:bifunctional 2-C-methyl-D-erythritol 4-phosphate cytidylyltransferase/2-C-methyl-D-erythritol 2,4-cyclodiphosphate synthase n=1 Tax=Caulobacter sp. NIBR2454 TaxID=3015996 RepID=UPI0022B69A24|nr:bifunctional 2-C-methyl-D-erythritol 4-phosphate cytidylyltransferase/2-C-methyl-D-erythritol 2,4-cyclodiphosphate synthase [Caulobacter sp. NIBR2454]